jgi:beta-1,4-mannosyl-glycoprotein beta-1,4-N-acetylglucosaminyltransferase
MKIYDCTTYFSEDLMLDVRFNILDKHVHKFIVVESLFSHSGNKKKLNFDIKKFKKFKDKIIYLVIEEEPKNIDLTHGNNIPSHIKRTNSLKRIEQSYDFMKKGVEDALDDDLIILSDNDEIPNLKSKQLMNSNFNNVIIFEQLFFYYKFNLLYDQMLWHGSKACKKKFLKSFTWLRNLKNKKYPIWRLDTHFTKTKIKNLEIIKNGGWHFTNVKTAEDLYIKLKNFGHHNEFEDSGTTLDMLKKQISNNELHYNHYTDQKDQNKYLFSHKLKKVKAEILPNYLRDNIEKYKEWFS